MQHHWEMLLCCCWIVEQDLQEDVPCILLCKQNGFFSVTGEEFEVLSPCQLSEVREAYLCESDRQQLLVNVAEK